MMKKKLNDSKNSKKKWKFNTLLIEQHQYENELIQLKLEELHLLNLLSLKQLCFTKKKNLF